MREFNRVWSLLVTLLQKARVELEDRRLRQRDAQVGGVEGAVKVLRESPGQAGG